MRAIMNPKQDIHVSFIVSPSLSLCMLIEGEDMQQRLPGPGFEPETGCVKGRGLKPMKMGHAFYPCSTAVPKRNILNNFMVKYGRIRKYIRVSNWKEMNYLETTFRKYFLQF
ncbi:hypothetical protein GOODEAATRI_007103 [Goodea atripinnis]|uniref:Uncharacterized protein n=1 Tax=Goodea atripinnis TaxID=208336 RepID=A0ABV0N8L5_9TELE